MFYRKRLSQKLKWYKTFILTCEGSTLGGNQGTNKVFSPRISQHKMWIWSTNVKKGCTWKLSCKSQEFLGSKHPLC